MSSFWQPAWGSLAGFIFSSSRLFSIRQDIAMVGIVAYTDCFIFSSAKGRGGSLEPVESPSQFGFTVTLSLSHLSQTYLLQRRSMPPPLLLRGRVSSFVPIPFFQLFFDFPTNRIPVERACLPRSGLRSSTLNPLPPGPSAVPDSEHPPRPHDDRPLRLRQIPPRTLLLKSLEHMEGTDGVVRRRFQVHFQGGPQRQPLTSSPPTCGPTGSTPTSSAR